MEIDEGKIIEAKKNAIVAHMTQYAFVSEIETFLIKIKENYTPNDYDIFIRNEWDAMIDRIYPLKHLFTPDIFWYYDKTEKILFIIPKNDITVALFNIIKRNTILCDTIKDQIILYECELEAVDMETEPESLFFSDNTGDNNLMMTKSKKNGYYNYNTKEN